MRIARYLSLAGLCSRREAERRIEDGRVCIDGQTLTSPAQNVTGRERITMDGKAVPAPGPMRLWRFHKPRGVLTTNHDPQNRKTLFSILPPDMPRVLSVGRLDLNTEGLLLLTNHGALARALELPANGLVRQYRARVYGRVHQRQLTKLAKGLTLNGIRYRPITARLCPPEENPSSPNQAWIELAFAEGKNREARKILESLDLKVSRLIRTQYGPLALETLAPGDVREVAPQTLQACFGNLLPESETETLE